MTKIGVYPGSFDPITIGHADIIKSALIVVDKLIIAVAKENNKNSIFSVEERVELINSYLPEFLSPGLAQRVEVKPFSGLLVDFVDAHNSQTIFRGIRAVSDFEYEFQLACVNSRLRSEIQTIFLPASERNQYISSRFVKEVARLGGDLSSFSGKYVINKLRQYYNS